MFSGGDFDSGGQWQRKSTDDIKVDDIFKNFFENGGNDPNDPLAE